MGTELKIDKLRNVKKLLSGKGVTARIGISDPALATIGAAHEFGTSTLPVRSFLRVPLTENLGKRVEQSREFNKDVLSQAVKTKSMVPWVKIISNIAEDIVHEAFDSAGNGAWPPTEKSTGHPILVDTGALRDSITVEIKQAGD